MNIRFHIFIFNGEIRKYYTAYQQIRVGKFESELNKQNYYKTIKIASKQKDFAKNVFNCRRII